MAWNIYILECGDGSLYTGIAKNVASRIELHNRGKGAKYTAAKLPVKLVWQESCPTRSSALIREAAIKKLSRIEKLKLVMKFDLSH